MPKSFSMKVATAIAIAKESIYKPAARVLKSLLSHFLERSTSRFIYRIQNNIW